MKKLGIATLPLLVSSGLSGGLVYRTATRLRGLAMYCALGLALYAGTTVAQEVNIPSYCADMAKAQYPVYDNRAVEYERRCVATLEVQRKHQREAQQAQERRDRDFRSANTKVEWAMALTEQEDRVFNAANSVNRDKELQRLKVLIAACPRFLSPEDCTGGRIELEQRFEKELNMRIDLR